MIAAYIEKMICLSANWSNTSHNTNSAAHQLHRRERVLVNSTPHNSPSQPSDPKRHNRFAPLFDPSATPSSHDNSPLMQDPAIPNTANSPIEIASPLAHHALPEAPSDAQVRFLLSLYEHLPVMVAQLTFDGHVLRSNPEFTRITGYSPADLEGKNFWALLFPGRLFAQVPRFVSAVHPSPLLRDIPMVIRTKRGQERTIAWTRFVVTSANESPCIVCVGSDLTDRLMDSDRLPNVVLPANTPCKPTLPDLESLASTDSITPTENPADTPEIDGTFVTPLAVSPPALKIDDRGGKAIQDVHEFLTQVETRLHDLQMAFHQGQIRHVANLADQLKTGAYACGLLAFSSAAQNLHSAASTGAVDLVTTRVHELVTLCNPATKAHNP